MRKNLLRTFLVAIALALIGAVSASALKIEIDKTLVSATVSVAPRELPARGNAPVEVSSVTRIKTNDGSPPLDLSEIVFMFDKHGSVNTMGLPVCTRAKLAGHHAGAGAQALRRRDRRRRAPARRRRARCPARPRSRSARRSPSSTRRRSAASRA